MPRKRKSFSKAASPVAAVPHDSALSSCPGEPTTFQLAVVNSCLWNEDVQLPRLPTPALLAPFYAQYNSYVAAGSCRAASPWTNDYWCTKVAHVALGRHSALPAIYRLRHECAGRLHARVVYVQTAAVHRQLHKTYPPLPRSGTKAMADGGVGDHHDVVIVEPTTPGVDVAADAAGPPPPTAFTASYYLLINHSENPIFVGPDRVPQGRSVALREGDVLSFLECAFDEDGGVLDGADVLDRDGAEWQSGHTPIDTEGVERAATTVEQVQQLAEESLWRCLGASSARAAPRSPSSSALTIHPVRVPHRTVALRRFYNVPQMIQEYMRWWHCHTAQLLAPHQVDGGHAASPSAESLSPNFSWMVSGNHLVRAPGIARRGPGSEEPACPNVKSACDTPATTAMRPSSSRCSQRQGSGGASTPPHMQQRFSEDLLHAPALLRALHQWLRETEDVEEVADEAHSPLAARLVLDRAWLWRLVRRHHRQQATPRSPPSSPDARNAACLSVAKRQESQTSTGDVAERFRISVPNVMVDPVASGDGTSLAPKAAPSRGVNPLQKMLEELRQRHSKEGCIAVAGPATGMGQPLCLDAELIDVYTSSTGHAATSPASREAPRWSLTSRPPTVSTGLPTCVPAVRITPAVLPVYVFTRRSRSSDVYTRERNSFTPECLPSPTSPTGIKRTRGARAARPTSGLGAAKQFVYYYYEADDQLSGRASAAAVEHQQPHPRGGMRKTSGVSAVGGPSPALLEPSPPAPSAAASLLHESRAASTMADDSFLWVDEAETTEEEPRAPTSRKRRSTKKTAPARKRRTSQAISSTAVAKAPLLEGASAAANEPPPRPAATSKP
ncbi:hypothetical protein LSCM1_00827 [Leishmania martiniquensis]|uniref:FHA domain-containing protein n=1 Tax=Leishmania martiniquensis TaxID=1580590 RepID=A0A836KIA8_9TRYP|nr:hypothetical protein LSCM1_00827 [Leishmania martiniquensis]